MTNSLAPAALAALFLTVALGCTERGTDAPSAETPAPDQLLAAGQAAPDFATTAHDGTAVSLAALRDEPVVLFFYPKDGTPG